jgi:hypothetical protein
MAKKKPDVDVTTSVRAKELRFGIVPEVKVRFDGEPAQESATWSDRGSLPDQVEPGVAYRDVDVGWSAAARVVHPTDAEEEGEEVD